MHLLVNGLIKIAEETIETFRPFSDLSRIINRNAWAEHYIREFNEWYELPYQEWE